MPDFINPNFKSSSYQNQNDNTLKNNGKSNTEFKNIFSALSKEKTIKTPESKKQTQSLLANDKTVKPKIEIKKKVDKKKEKIVKKEPLSIKNSTSKSSISKSKGKSFSSKSKNKHSSANKSTEDEDEEIESSEKSEFEKEVNKVEEHKHLTKEIVKKSTSLQKNQQDKSYKDDSKEEKRKKRSYYYDFDENTKHSDADFFEILSSYGIYEKNYDSNKVKNILNVLTEENLTYSDSKKISEYITSKLSDEKEIHPSDRSIFQNLITDLLSREITQVHTGIYTRFHEDSVDKIFSSIPEKFLKGILDKLVTTYKNDKTKYFKVLSKICNGHKITFEESEFFSELFVENFEDEELEVLQNIFSGEYHKDLQDKIYDVMVKLEKENALIPGFLETLSTLFIDSHSNNQKEISKKLLSYMELYQNEKLLSIADTKIIASLISKKFLEHSKIESSKTQDLLENLISNTSIQHFQLESISNNINKNLLPLLPYNINEENRNFLKYLPFMENEVSFYDKKSFSNQENTYPFNLYGKVILNSKNKPNKISITLIDSNDNSFVFEIIDNQLFNFELNVGKYTICTLTIDNFKFNLSKNKNHLDLLSFIVGSFTDIFYFGTLKLTYIESSIKSIELKNNYKDFSDQIKLSTPEALKAKQIKVNPKLYR